MPRQRRIHLELEFGGCPECRYMPTAPLTISSTITAETAGWSRQSACTRHDRAHDQRRGGEPERNQLVEVLDVAEQQQLDDDADDAEQQDRQQDAARGVAHRRLKRNSSILPSGARYISVRIGVVPGHHAQRRHFEAATFADRSRLDLADFAGILQRLRHRRQPLGRQERVVFVGELRSIDGAGADLPRACREPHPSPADPRSSARSATGIIFASTASWIVSRTPPD